MEHENSRGLLDRGEHRALVPGKNRAQIDDLDRGTELGGEKLGCLGPPCAPSRPGHHRDIRTLSLEAGFADWCQIAAVRHVPPQAAVEVLVLEVEDGIRVGDRGGEQAFGVGRGGGADELQAGDVGEARLGVLRVDRPA